MARTHTLLLSVTGNCKTYKANHSCIKVRWTQWETKITTRALPQAKNRSFTSKKCSSGSVRLVRIICVSRSWECMMIHAWINVRPSAESDQPSNYFLHYLPCQPDQTSTDKASGVNHQLLLIVSHIWNGVETSEKWKCKLWRPISVLNPYATDMMDLSYLILKETTADHRTVWTQHIVETTHNDDEF